MYWYPVGRRSMRHQMARLGKDHVQLKVADGIDSREVD
jgi:hypothetical protein